ncbi:glucose-6-phosphate dehydrogenase [Amylibacter sp. SFDW26]|uniref:glucose-6-phosphate dehydrogenase n=1 Tax=Amylibacter sp. SFDW26 TaxID=2652722 RepID=UPI0012628A0A|nr:glucose-6-phosphate dehydrogenase [Amylibacter sp. SFDW26]KAB7615621.1 glucose-6-phosphate dehydrogenase [Amylibacter sp. SFDW26]
MVAQTIPVDDFDLVIIGGTGDLAKRKILPGLYRRMCAGQMPEGARIIAAARSDYSQKDFKDFVQEALESFVKSKKRNAEKIQNFLERLSYIKLDAMGEEGWKELAGSLRKDVVRAFYFSVGPSLFAPLAERLKLHKITDDASRIVVEKPFGRDLATAQALNDELANSFNENQIYRIDHYLGKETVQNLMALRFGNALFEPLWNAQHIDHVQITAAESLGVEGRGAYYDKSGAMRDMVQNHLMQLLCLTAMEPPTTFDAESVRNEKLKVIKALDPLDIEGGLVRGQYRADDKGQDYRTESGNPNSRTESFVAMKVEVSNWRWTGTPFYLRTGKKLRTRVSEIAIVFKDPPHSIFADSQDLKGNILTIRLQPDEGINLSMTIKEPGPGGMRLREVPLDMTFADALGEDIEDMPDAYERLIMDVIRGNQTLFMRGDEVEAAWAWIDPAIKAWEAGTAKPVEYDAGGNGPDDSLMLMHKDHRRWREISS